MAATTFLDQATPLLWAIRAALGPDVLDLMTALDSGSGARRFLTGRRALRAWCGGEPNPGGRLVSCQQLPDPEHRHGRSDPLAGADLARVVVSVLLP